MLRDPYARSYERGSSARGSPTRFPSGSKQSRHGRPSPAMTGGASGLSAAGMTIGLAIGLISAPHAPSLVRSTAACQSAVCPTDRDQGLGRRLDRQRSGRWHFRFALYQPAPGSRRAAWPGRTIVPQDDIKTACSFRPNFIRKQYFQAAENGIASLFWLPLPNKRALIGVELGRWHYRLHIVVALYV